MGRMARFLAAKLALTIRTSLATSLITYPYVLPIGTFIGEHPA